SAVRLVLVVYRPGALRGPPALPTRRSSDLGGQHALGGAVAPGQLESLLHHPPRGGEIPLAVLVHLGDLLPRAGIEVAGGAGRRLDRKRTRLNSSHGSISYAVICLKA